MLIATSVTSPLLTPVRQMQSEVRLINLYIIMHDWQDIIHHTAGIPFHCEL